MASDYIDPDTRFKGLERWLGENSNTALMRIFGVILLLDIVVVAITRLFFY